jgi:hypothetical protein
MAQEDFDLHGRRLDRRRFLLTAALAAAAGSVIAAQALEAAGTVPAQPTEGDVNAWYVGLITAHRPEVTPDENSLRMGELRTEIGGWFGVLEVRGRYVPRAGAEPIEERAFFLRGRANDSGNLKGFLRTAGRKFGQAAVIWKGNDQDVVLFALKEWPALGLRVGDKKNLGPFRTNQIAQYHALLARKDAAPGQWEDLGVWTMRSFFSRQSRRVFV